MVLVFIQYSFNAIFSPMISELYGKNEIIKIEQLFKLQTRWSFTLTLPLLLLILFFSTPILKIFGQYFEEGALALIIMSIGRFFDAGIGACGMMLMMVGKPKINTINSAIILGLKIIFNVILIPQYGLIGAAISSSISVALINLMRVIEVFYILKIHPYSLKFLKPISSALLSVCVIILARLLFEMDHIKILSIGLMASCFLLSYFIMLYFLKLDDEDRYVFRRFYQKLLWSSEK